ncbi:TetR/AcrR family transcriptional regulator [Rugamonas sp.]|uniref:TetR/AcrR family transcriptional regulator n=1 Tax=Rugamonas sp. TaxID=1926287 RepID=UPI0025F97DDF|nr:TetR/AcrR family transcriptional regulator [Rugamonas sp.]
MKKSKADTVETRKRIVAVASRVFLAQGLAATGIADIMAAAGLTPGGFYRHFESKEQLIAEANSAASAQLLDVFAKATAGQQPREALATVVSLYLDQSEQVSALCSLASLGSELRHADDHVKDIAMNGYRRMIEFVSGLTRLLGVPDPASVADAIVSTLVGAVTISRLATDAALAQTIRDHARAVVGSLAGKTPSPSASPALSSPCPV